MALGEKIPDAVNRIPHKPGEAVNNPANANGEPHLLKSAWPVPRSQAAAATGALLFWCH